MLADVVDQVLDRLLARLSDPGGVVFPRAIRPEQTAGDVTIVVHAEDRRPHEEGCDLLVVIDGGEQQAFTRGRTLHDKLAVRPLRQIRPLKLAFCLPSCRIIGEQGGRLFQDRDDHAGLHQARSCLLAAAGGGTSRNTAARLRVIAAHLRGEPGALASGETTAPIDVLRLISELRRAGRSDVAQPRCADCGRDRFLRARRPDGQRVCASCSQAYHLPERCGRCGQQARVCARDPGGGAVCEQCRRADPSAWKPCGICGGNAWTRITINGTRIGDCCYLHPHERCSACGIGRAVSPCKTRKATCAACATAPLAACSSCGLDAQVPQAGEAPLCLRCASGATRRCAGCQAPTVSRAVGGEPRCLDCYSRPERACAGGCASSSGWRPEMTRNCAGAAGLAP